MIPNRIVLEEEEKEIISKIYYYLDKLERRKRNLMVRRIMAATIKGNLNRDNMPFAIDMGTRSQESVGLA